jgi:hypothetical protein
LIQPQNLGSCCAKLGFWRVMPRKSLFKRLGVTRTQPRCMEIKQPDTERQMVALRHTLRALRIIAQQLARQDKNARKHFRTTRCCYGQQGWIERAAGIW